MNKTSPASSLSTYLIQLDTLSTANKQQGEPGCIWELLPTNLLQLCRRKNVIDNEPLIIENWSDVANAELKFKSIDLELFKLLIAIPHKNRLVVFNDSEWLKDGKSIVVGAGVIVFQKEDQYSGIVRCKVYVKNHKGYHFGIELDEEFKGKGTSSGEYQGEHFFECPEDCGMFVPLHKLRLNPDELQLFESNDKDKQTTFGLESQTKNKIKATFDCDRSEGPNTDQQGSISVGERVVWLTDGLPEYDGIPQYGTVKWIGNLPGSREVSAGVEFENPIGSGTGSYQGTKLFTAKRNHASLMPLMGLLRAADFDAPPPQPSVFRGYSVDDPMRDNVSFSSGNSGYGDSIDLTGRTEMDRFFATPSASLKGHVMPPDLSGDDVNSICGLGKGIQGAAQSTGSLESILFAMFYLYDTFDSYIFPGEVNYDADLGEIKQLRRTLVDHIINPLRQNGFVSCHKVKQFREECNYALAACNLITANPSEVFCHIVGNIVRMNSLFTLSTGEPYNVYEIPHVNSVMSPPNIQHLLDCASLVANHRIQFVPESVFVLDVCISGKVVFPSSTIDISDLIENFPRECKICGVMAEVECADCFTMKDACEATTLPEITFCRACSKSYHQNPNRKSHRPPKELNPTTSGGVDDVIPSRVIMELFAVVVSGERYFTSFVKSSGLGADSVWLMHEVMAEKTEGGSGIPEVKRCDEMEKCFDIVAPFDIHSLPKVAQKIITGMRLCFYRRIIADKDLAN